MSLEDLTAKHDLGDAGPGISSDRAKRIDRSSFNWVTPPLPHDISVVFEDHDLLVVNKPSGMLTHGHSFCPGEKSLVSHLKAYHKDPIFLAHRLDRATEGLVIFAKNKQTASVLGEAFRTGTIKKTYLALVRGFADSSGRIEKAISDETGSEPKAASSEWTKLFEVELPHALGRYPTTRYSLVRVSTTHGRRHQVRLHMKSLRHPILGDSNYGDSKHNKFFREHFGINHLMLFAESVSWSPVTAMQNLSSETYGAHRLQPFSLQIDPPPHWIQLFSHFGWVMQSAFGKQVISLSSTK